MKVSGATRVATRIKKVFNKKKSFWQTKANIFQKMFFSFLFKPRIFPDMFSEEKKELGPITGFTNHNNGALDILL